ncbi:M20/M25/M40 family metallo-hydrolase [Aliikangiella sp. G2MR2-5]|uniref:M20/M25/M40 family metallo-hydrolase n=1 Tax=Aliikangiella sp. G2MR2-5 TaxID=2788943 RepID=UPI0018AB274E|nr:M20/M25/M40 family metallo-hydrolase [Aliikangiella sp. G2MR2-5]
MKIASPALFFSFFCMVAQVQANSISLEKLTNDVTELASDEMSGRKTATSGANKAAEYIAKRFHEIGLDNFDGLKSFEQKFKLYQVFPKTVNATLNGTTIDQAKIILMTNHESLSWKKTSSVKQLHIGPIDSFRDEVGKINQSPDNYLVTVDPSHQEIFSRYQKFLSRGLNQFQINSGPSAVFILSNSAVKNSYSIRAQMAIEHQTLTNVVGVLPGRKLADEFVLFSAHYDHLGVHENNADTHAHSSSSEKPKHEDNIYNGADDDASGTSAVINLAEYFARKGNNERTLIFVAFTAEEIGGFGSRYFSEQLPPEKIIAMLNIEMIGKPSKFGKGALWMTGFERSSLAQILNKNLKRLNKEIFQDPYPEQQLFYRSDNATLARLGVPAHSFSSSQIDKDQHYHQPSDEIGTLDLESMHQVISTLAEAVESLIDGSDKPDRVDTSKVRPKGNYF